MALPANLHNSHINSEVVMECFSMTVTKQFYFIYAAMMTNSIYFVFYNVKGNVRHPAKHVKID